MSPPTSIAANAVAEVARPAVESAKIGLVCSATRPYTQACRQHKCCSDSQKLKNVHALHQQQQQGCRAGCKCRTA